MKDCSNGLDRKIISGERCVSLGKLSSNTISFIHSHFQYLGASIDPNAEVLFWKDRISHTEHHKDDFFSETLYEQCFHDIPLIIQNPDYIAVKENNRSISFIKRLSQDVSVVVRVSNNGGLSYRTMYPLLSSQLDDYLRRKTAYKCSDA